MGDVLMLRSDYEMEIIREDGTVQSIKMYCTAYQANKAFTAMGYALNRSNVEQLTLWVYSRISRVRCNRITYGKAQKAA